MAQNEETSELRSSDFSKWCDSAAYCEVGWSRDRLLLEVSDVIGQAGKLPDLFRELADRIFRAKFCCFLHFSLYDPQQNCMITHYWRCDRENGLLDAFPVDACMSGSVWRDQKAIQIADIQDLNYPQECIAVLRKHRVRSYTAVPITAGDERLGALGVGLHSPRLVGSEDVNLLSLLARMVALAIQNMHSQRTLQEQDQKLRSLLCIGEKLTVSLKLDELLPVIFSGIREITACDYAAVAILEQDGKHLRRLAADWTPELRALHEALPERFPISDPIAGRVIQTRNVVFYNHSDLEQMTSAVAKLAYDAGFRSICSVPLISGTEILGSLCLGSLKNPFRDQNTEYLKQIAGQIAIALQNARSLREVEVLKERLAGEKRYLSNENRDAAPWGDVIGSSTSLKRVMEQAAIVAATDSTILITGETGTGKERIARAIHTLSHRSDRSFIKLNCAAIPTGLLESELFGHEKGAFTGAISQKIGRLELADKGTLFLDEIGEIPLELQPKLLRVLQDQEFERLGGTRTIHVDVRLIAATNRDLIRAVEDKEFRSDLFYRLHVFPIHLPPLRDRREDIPLLVNHFAAKFSARLKRCIDVVPDDAIEAMLKWHWPGNIRELENFIERSVILSHGPALRVPLAELQHEISRRQTASGNTLRDKEREHIIQVLRQSRGVLSGPAGAATRLGLKRTTLQYKMQKLGISRMDYLD